MREARDKGFQEETQSKVWNGAQKIKDPTQATVSQGMRRGIARREKTDGKGNEQREKSSG